MLREDWLPFRSLPELLAIGLGGCRSNVTSGMTAFCKGTKEERLLLLLRSVVSSFLLSFLGATIEDLLLVVAFLEGSCTMEDRLLVVAFLEDSCTSEAFLLGLLAMLSFLWLLAMLPRFIESLLGDWSESDSTREPFLESTEDGLIDFFLGFPERGRTEFLLESPCLPSPELGVMDCRFGLPEVGRIELLLEPALLGETCWDPFLDCEGVREARLESVGDRREPRLESGGNNEFLLERDLRLELWLITWLGLSGFSRRAPSLWASCWNDMHNRCWKWLFCSSESESEPESDDDNKNDDDDNGDDGDDDDDDDDDVKMFSCARVGNVQNKWPWVCENEQKIV